MKHPVEEIQTRNMWNEGKYPYKDKLGVEV